MKVSKCGQRRLCSDCSDVRDDLRVRMADVKWHVFFLTCGSNVPQQYNETGLCGNLHYQEDFQKCQYSF